MLDNFGWALNLSIFGRSDFLIFEILKHSGTSWKINNPASLRSWNIMVRTYWKINLQYPKCSSLWDVEVSQNNICQNRCVIFFDLLVIQQKIGGPKSRRMVGDISNNPRTHENLVLGTLVRQDWIWLVPGEAEQCYLPLRRHYLKYVQ